MVKKKEEKIENARLGLRGILNVEKWKELDDKARRKFLKAHANEVLPKLVHMNPLNEADEEMLKVYDVTASYQLMDCHYNRQGEVIAELEWSRIGGAKLKSFNEIK